MANRTTRTPKKDGAFLDALSDGKSVSAACVDAGITRSRAYQWRSEDEAFARAWDEAVEEGTDRMEDEAYRRAVQGTTKPIFQQGRKVGEIQEYSDTLMIFMLKGRRPEKYRERSAVELTGVNGGPIQTEEVSARDVLASRISGLAARSGANSGDPEPH